MRTISVALACIVSAGILASAQQPSAAPQEKPPAASAAPAEKPQPLVPLRVQILLSRFKGDKKIGSLPYVLGLAANDRTTASLRMGIEVPIGSRSYRSVGTNIDCHAQSLPGELYRLAITVEDSSVLPEETAAGTPDKAAGPVPVQRDMPPFRSFKSTFTAVLRDGQTMQYTSAVDPISGEVMKIDVTLNVAK